MLSTEAISRLEARIVPTFGDLGRRWLANLPVLLDQVADRLELKLLPPYSNLTYNYVAPAIRSDGRDVVLKLGVPNPELTSEVCALRHFAGDGCVDTLYSEPQAGILGLERRMPGRPLTPLANDCTDDQATSIASTVMRTLHKPWREDADHGAFRSVSELGQGFGRLRKEFSGGVGPFPRNLVEEAERRLWLELDKSASVHVLLHGDLHHDNIISAVRAPWLAIDPKGYIGDPIFDTGALLRNLWRDHHPISNPAQTIERRIDQFADELQIDRERVKGWGFAQAVLSVWWSYEDGEPEWADSLEIARIIAGLGQ